MLLVWDVLRMAAGVHVIRNTATAARTHAVIVVVVHGTTSITYIVCSIVIAAIIIAVIVVMIVITAVIRIIDILVGRIGVGGIVAGMVGKGVDVTHGIMLLHLHVLRVTMCVVVCMRV